MSTVKIALDWSDNPEYGEWLLYPWPEMCQALGEAIAMADEYGPRKPHAGPCGPESGCDGYCMAFAAWSATVQEWRRILDDAEKRLYGMRACQMKALPRECGEGKEQP